MNRVWRFLVASLVAIVPACGDDDSGLRPDARPVDTRPPPDADFGAVPRVEPVPCRFQISSGLGLAPGTDYSCGDLVVEENRDAHTGRIRLHFIRIKSTATTNRGTIYLDGGPGGDGQGILDYIAYHGRTFLDGLLVDGDFLVIGQRGTGKSLPFLECTQASCDLGDADLTAYNTAYNADDVDELRATIGLDALNVYGISYGSRLGLEVLRRHGDKVRAAVIEGLVPAQTIWPAAIPASAYGAITALNASCADAGACGTTFGNLVTKFTAGVAALNDSPLPIPTSNGTVDLDGYTYAHIVFRMLYSRSSYPWLPLMISDFAAGRADRVGTFVGQWLDVDRDSRISRGLYYSVVCGELYNPPNASAFDAANAGVPAEFIDLFGASYYSLEDVCSSWPKHALGSALAQPVTSSVRTLVSSGRLDPITPPSFGALAASSLDNSVVVLHENSGHGATLQSDCGKQNLLAFLAAPNDPLDTSCAATITNSYMIPGMAVGVPLPSKAQLRAELGVVSIPPLERPRPLARRR
jgi:pimeloyl-ACP methyl ester carboxylesterase